MAADDGESEERPGGQRWWRYLRDIVSSVGAVAMVGLFVFAVSGLWPPLVAIESPSMEPNIETGDMVFVMSAERFPGENATHGIVTAAAGTETGYDRFGRGGDVIIYEPDGDERRTPVIHRAMLWVEGGENWYDRADEDALGTADDCAALRYCPAPHAGFITKGDYNGGYDQLGERAISEPVRPEWIVGTAEARASELGWLSLRSSRAETTQRKVDSPAV
ncbi:S26 family signal peptidase [Haloarcula pelagica]|uniref:S26 family signal peptidase n=1 Tax=Haloarcula pelagica TaxID=3033389 RepID=UPI0024C352F6|nr:S26 family signal peptidase [Halomicroarcula sp. YJ-61-S]